MEKESKYVYNLTITTDEKPDQEKLFDIANILQDEMSLHMVEIDYLGEREYKIDD